MSDSSSITNCMLYARQHGETIFSFNNDGSAFVHLDRYLICPIEMFTQQQIETAAKKFVSRALEEGK